VRTTSGGKEEYKREEKNEIKRRKI